MAKISRDLLRRHDAACALLALDRPLTEDEVHTVLEDWHEGASHANSRTGAHFTPKGLARDFALEIAGHKIIDLCAGIGMLSYMSCMRDEHQANYTLVELNPDYAAVARRIMPGAEVIVGSMFDPVLIAELRSRNFDTAISNPPYGRFNAANGKGLRYTGSDCHYAVIDVASEIARNGVFLLPQNATPFRFSGKNRYSEVAGSEARAYEAFRDQTGIEFTFNAGIDTEFYRDDWRDVGITVEIINCDFEEAARKRTADAIQAEADAAVAKPSNQFSLFEIAA